MSFFEGWGNSYNEVLALGSAVSFPDSVGFHFRFLLSICECHTQTELDASHGSPRNANALDQTSRPTQSKSHVARHSGRSHEFVTIVNGIQNPKMGTKRKAALTAGLGGLALKKKKKERNSSMEVVHQTKHEEMSFRTLARGCVERHQDAAASPVVDGHISKRHQANCRTPQQHQIVGVDQDVERQGGPVVTVDHHSAVGSYLARRRIRQLEHTLGSDRLGYTGQMRT